MEGMDSVASRNLCRSQRCCGSRSCRGCQYIMYEKPAICFGGLIRRVLAGFAITCPRRRGAVTRNGVPSTIFMATVK